MRYDGMEQMFYWKRGELLQLSPFFSTKEMECKCGKCLEQKISSDLIHRLTQLRIQGGKPLVVTSAFRCTRYQMELAGKGFETARGTSQHELGKAADITCIDLNLIENYFTSIGVANTFTHVDLRPQIIRWAYGKRVDSGTP